MGQLGPQLLFKAEGDGEVQVPEHLESCDHRPKRETARARSAARAGAPGRTDSMIGSTEVTQRAIDLGGEVAFGVS